MCGEGFSDSNHRYGKYQLSRRSNWDDRVVGSQREIYIYEPNMGAMDLYARLGTPPPKQPRDY